MHFWALSLKLAVAVAGEVLPLAKDFVRQASKDARYGIDFVTSKLILQKCPGCRLLNIIIGHA